MNVVSVQIYSDQNTSWDRSKIDFPINIENTNWPGNGCGLCNQVFKLINTIAFNQGSDIYVDLFSKDYSRGNTIGASDIFNLEEMRKLGHRLYDIVDMDYNQNYVIKTYPWVYMLYHQNLILYYWEIVMTLIYNHMHIYMHLYQLIHYDSMKILNLSFLLFYLHVSFFEYLNYDETLIKMLLYLQEK